MKSTLGILVFSITTITPCLMMATPVTIADWTFETSVPASSGPVAPETGAGVGIASHHAGSSTLYSNPTGNGSLESWGADHWAVGDYWQFSVSTVNYDNIVLSWDQTSSNTGPGVFALLWSVDGINFTQFGNNYGVPAPTTTWHGYTNDLSSITALDDLSTVYFRLVDTNTTSANGGTVAGGGTDRVDNFIVSGDRIPSPVPDSFSELLGLSFAIGLLAFLKTGNPMRALALERVRSRHR